MLTKKHVVRASTSIKLRCRTFR